MGRLGRGKGVGALGFRCAGVQYLGFRAREGVKAREARKRRTREGVGASGFRGVEVSK